MPWILLYSKDCNSRSEALKLEKQLKGLKSRDDILRYTLNHDFMEH
jgi:putative endonuclease